MEKRELAKRDMWSLDGYERLRWQGDVLIGALLENHTERGYKKALAEALEITPSFMCHLKKNERPIPRWVYKKMIEMLRGE